MGKAGMLNGSSRNFHRQNMVDEELQAPLALILIYIEPVHELHRALRGHELAGLLDVIKRDRIERASGSGHFHPHLQMPIADHSSVANGEDAIETRLWKRLSPWATGA